MTRRAQPERCNFMRHLHRFSRSIGVGFGSIKFRHLSNKHLIFWRPMHFYAVVTRFGELLGSDIAEING